MTAVETARLDIAAGKLGRLTAAQEAQVVSLARGLDLLKTEPLKLPFEELRRREFDTSVSPESAREFKRFNDEQERLAQLLAATPSAALERQRKDIELLGEALARTDISARQFDEAKRAIEATNGAAKELGLTFSSAFEDAIVEGSKLSDVLKGLAQDILRIAVRKNVTEPLAGALTGLFAGGFHAGGIVGAGGAGGMGPALAFAGAPRYHAGGISGFRPDEVPAVLQRGEEVLRRDDPRHRANMQAGALPSAGGGMPAIEFINKGTPQREVGRQTLPDGHAAGDGRRRDRHERCKRRAWRARHAIHLRPEPIAAAAGADGDQRATSGPGKHWRGLGSGSRFGC